jgi:hypothetical protein
MLACWSSAIFWKGIERTGWDILAISPLSSWLQLRHGFPFADDRLIGTMRLVLPFNFFLQNGVSKDRISTLLLMCFAEAYVERE